MRAFTFLAFLAASLSAARATVVLLPPTPYLRFTDSPFHAAAAAGDAVKFLDIACNDPGPPLPNGLGVHDTFIDPDCLSPWVRLTLGRYSLGAAVDEENGPQGDPGGWYIFGDGLGQRPVVEFTFALTPDGRLPTWGGFVITGMAQQVGLEILGEKGSVCIFGFLCP